MIVSLVTSVHIIQYYSMNNVQRHFRHYVLIGELVVILRHVVVIINLLILRGLHPSSRLKGTVTFTREHLHATIRVIRSVGRTDVSTVGTAGNKQ